MRLIFFFLLFPFCALTQQTIDADLFFVTGLSTFQKSEQADRENINFPWIDRYEFRTESRDFELDRQEYTVRVTPSTSKIRKAQKALYNDLVNVPDFEEQEMRCDHFYDLHIDWLSLFILNEQKNILDGMEILIADKESIYKKMIGTYEIDPQKIINLRTDKSDIRIELNNILVRQDYLLNKYELKDGRLIFDDFISIEAISNLLSGPALTDSETPDLDPKITYKQSLLAKELELEEAEKKKLIDFVQFKYNGPHDDLLRERFSVGLGFQIFNSGSTKLKMEELKIEQEELNREFARATKQKETETITLKNKLQRDLQAYFYFQQTIKEERTELQQFSKNIAQSEGTSPLLLLDIEERNLSLQLEALKLKAKLLEDYLDYLNDSDQMCGNEFVNFLSGR